MDDKDKKIESIDYEDPDAILTSGIFNSPGYIQRRESMDELRRKTAESDQRRYEHQQRTAAKRAKEERIRQAYYQSKNKSIGRHRKTKDTNRKRYSEINSKSIQGKIIIGLCTLVTTLTIAVPVAGIVLPEIEEKIQIQQDVDRSTDLLMAKAYNALTVNDLAGIDISTGKFVIKENSIAAYRRLGVTSDLDVYIYKLILPNSEFEKFIQSVSYNNGLHYYTGMHQFLNINGYYTEGTKSPSLKTFNNMMEQEIRRISSTLLNEYNAGDGVYTASDYLEEEGNQTKGR